MDSEFVPDPAWRLGLLKTNCPFRFRPAAGHRPLAQQGGAKSVKEAPSLELPSIGLGPLTL